MYCEIYQKFNLKWVNVYIIQFVLSCVYGFQIFMYIMCNIDINICEFYEERKELNERIIFFVF